MQDEIKSFKERLQQLEKENAKSNRFVKAVFFCTIAAMVLVAFVLVLIVNHHK